jgi:hypothetical protein
MANEFSMSGGLIATKAGVTPPGGLGYTWTNVNFNWVGTAVVSDLLTVPTSLTAIPLGSVSSPRWAQFWNQDQNNYVQIQNSAGANFLKLYPGDIIPAVPLDPAFVPYAIANTASILLFYIIWSV